MNTNRLHCWDIRNCPACEYMMCEAYTQGKNCWEVIDKPCCKRKDFSRCRNCSIYQQYLSLR